MKTNLRDSIRFLLAGAIKTYLAADEIKEYGTALGSPEEFKHSVHACLAFALEIFIDVADKEDFEDQALIKKGKEVLGRKI